MTFLSIRFRSVKKRSRIW